MAYAALVSLAHTIDLILNPPKYSIPRRDKHQMMRVKKNAILLQEFLEDFPEKAQSFEGRIMELTQRAEDILEFSLSEHIQQSLDSSKEKHQHLLNVNSYDELKRVMKEIESISKKVVEIKNSITNKDESVGDSTHFPSRSVPVQEEAMVGLENNMMEVKLRLCRDSSKLEILPIVGMGGIGKTTLVRNVYDDPLITDRFDVRAWVTVSQDYDLSKIVSGLLVSMVKLHKTTLARNHNHNSPSTEQFDIGSWDSISQDCGDVQEIAENQSVEEKHNMDYCKVHQHLKGRRYFIVIDDIWSIQAWDEIKLMFPDDGNGSRIMLTTRLSDVATYADSFSSFHDMRLMDDDESWKLLREKVFKRDSCPIELEYIGKKIARSCRGLPLAVVVISGLLAVDQTEASWKNIARDVKSSAFSANNEQIDKILSLSYTHLPHHLRSCFLYMGGFPEDHQTRVSTLTKLWVAEGFLKPDKYKSFEETAEAYLEDLVRRNLLMVTMRKSNGRAKFLGIHDLIREMCVKRAKEENFILLVKGVLQQDTTIPHRVSTTTSDLNFHENTRTIICLKHNRLRDDGCPLEHFKLLRVLAVSDAHKFFCNKDSNRSKVFELFHLRYLSFDSLFDIRASISNLQNLQTLVIGLKKQYVPIWLHELPVEIWRMPQLRHLLFYYGVLPCDEAEEFPLENLQTISRAMSFVCSRKIVKMIPNLKKLGVTYYNEWEKDHPEYEARKCKEDYELENLKYLQQLEILKITVKGRVGRPKLNPDYPRTLKKLSLDYLRVSWKDMNVVASLPCLEVLKLRYRACIGGTWETTEGGFPELRFLLIDELHFRHWITESSHFPRLKCLVIHKCWRLGEIPESIGEISTLELIEVDYRVKSLVRSAKQIRRDQRSCGNDALQVRILKRK